MTTTPSAPIPLSQFLSAAGRHGPTVGVVADDSGTPTPPGDTVWRVVDAAEMPTLAGLFDTFARAWEFPTYFGRNKDAFDECMRELPDRTGTSGEATTFVTQIDDAARLLRAEPDELSWFAKALDFYGEHYRDVADPPAGFAVLLRAPATLLRRVETRWHDAGSPIAVIEG